MERLEQILHRKSVRSYKPEALREEDQELLLSYASKAENPYGIPVSYYMLSASKDGLSSPVITGADTYITGTVRRLPHSEEAFGYSFEEVLLYADMKGIGTVWIAGTMNRDAFEKAVGLKEGEAMPCVSPLGYPEKKRSLRETMMRKGIKADSRFEFAEIFYDKEFGHPLNEEDAGILRDALEMVRWAPSAVNKQPWRVVLDGKNIHFYEKKSKGYVDASGWDIQKIDLGIALCHFRFGLEDKGLESEFLIQDPGIMKPQDVEYIASYRIK